MIDNRTTELRAKLTERGIEYTTNDHMGACETSWNGFTAMQLTPSAKLIMAVTPEQAIAATLGSEINGNTSDGYHTFNELYHHRAVLFSVIVRDHRELAWKALKHHDGTMYDGMFIVGIDTPKGQATYHYDLDPYWEMFDCKEREYAPEWDGHTSDDAIARIAELGCGRKVTELCPFCGGEASVKVLEYDDDCKVYGVFCESDLQSEQSHGHFIDNYPSEAEAITAWNTRADRM